MALDEFHGDELHTIAFSEVVDADYVAMRYTVRQQQFLLKPVDDGGILGQLRSYDLEGDHAVQFEILRLVDGAHAALAQGFQNLVASGENCARVQHRLRCLEALRARSAAWRRSHSFQQRRRIGKGNVRERHQSGSVRPGNTRRKHYGWSV